MDFLRVAVTKACDFAIMVDCMHESLCNGTLTASLAWMGAEWMMRDVDSLAAFVAGS